MPTKGDENNQRQIFIANGHYRPFIDNTILLITASDTGKRFPPVAEGLDWMIKPRRTRAATEESIQPEWGVPSLAL
jgi:hypothetical protein